jgi:hypothetical protein
MQSSSCIVWRLRKHLQWSPCRQVLARCPPAPPALPRGWGHQTSCASWHPVQTPHKPHSTKPLSSYEPTIQNHGIHTIADAEEEVQRARRKYEAKPKSAIRRLLGSFSLTMMHYAKILDVLVQHHPEYVSLAWGTTKLLFVVGDARY